jgi:hypothetical protein
MNSLVTTLLVFVCAFGGALLGIFIRRRLPEHHISPDSREVVRVGMALVASTVALVLGLLVYSAKGFFDTQTNEVTQLAANVILLDRVLAHYGPESAAVRAELQHAVTHQLDVIWSKEDTRATPSAGGAPTSEVILDKIHDLSPQNDTQRTMKSQAESLALQMAQTRFLMFEQRSVPVPTLLLVMLIFWLIALFASFGLFAPVNSTVVVSLFVVALAICGAVFLIVEMYFPYGGLIQVSSEPLRAALSQLGR